MKPLLLRLVVCVENGDGYSTDGYVYLTNEVTLALYFAYYHHRVDKSDSMVVFKMEIPDEMILPDYHI